MASAATVCGLVALVLAILVFIGWAMLLALAHGTPTPDDPLRF